MRARPAAAIDPLVGNPGERAPASSVHGSPAAARPAPAVPAPPVDPPTPAAAAAPARADAAHLGRLQELLRLEAAPPEPRSRRRRPSARQRLQQVIRQETVACYHALRDQGLTLHACSLLLHLAPRTLRSWDQAGRQGARDLVLVGRPATRAPRPVRQAILDYVKLTGPGVGVPTLQDVFPQVARGELADLLGRCRAVWHARHHGAQRRLHWQTPGCVWAVDFAELSPAGVAGVLPPIAGCYPYLLAVRDLASGSMLAWQALADLSAASAARVLAGLFGVHGAPLVVKVDNGSAFRAGPFQQLLEGAGVLPLYSPPACPGYNGAIEAAIGALKRRTEAQACGHGHAGVWELADLAAAQAVANAGHPRRLNGRTPGAVWEARRPVTALERVVFALTVERQRFGVREELGLAQDAPLDHWRQSAVDRRAIERALVGHGHLLFTRRRIPLPIQVGKAAADG